MQDQKPPKQIGVSFGRIFLVFGVLVVILAGALYAWHRYEHSGSAATTPTKPKASQPVTITTVDATYLSAPKQLGDLHIFADPSSLGEICTSGDDCRATVSSDIQYYRIGTTQDDRQVLVFVYSGDGMDGETEIMLGSNGKYQILAQMDSGYADIIKQDGAAAFIKDNSAGFASNVSYDVTTKLAGLDFPTSITAKGVSYALSSNDPDGNYGSFMQNGLADFSAAGTRPTVLSTTGNRTLYSVVATDAANFQVIGDYATFNNLFAEEYDLQNSLLDAQAGDKVLTVNWQSGQQNKSAYFSAASGCGASGYVIAKGVMPGQLTAVGTSSDGQTLYQLAATAPLSQELYTKDYGESKDSIDDASLKNLTMQQFMDDHAYVMFKDALGEYVVLQRSDLFVTGGCAKPVVYLYPQQKTTVSVQVGAHVTNSDPLYTANGWQGVIAEPSGALSYQGKPYNSLFWEGKGYGAYPAITNGTVVPSSQAVATIKTQLKAQGLNVQETADFLAYWQPKLPKTPYVRLTWLSTAQMNQLAPLHVSPEPQTLIRVFLDFEGLQQPEELPAQHFVAPARRGFTVVEWGGLARNGLQG